MEAAEMPSSQVQSTGGDDGDGDGEVVCRIAFEEYLSEWVKLATTRAGHLTGRGCEYALDEQRSERFAARYGVPGGETNELAEELPKTFKDMVTYEPRPRRSKNRKSRQTRAEQMRRLYLLCKTPDPEVPPVPALREPVHDAERRERWESEVDTLVAWTHSLSVEDLDRP